LERDDRRIRKEPVCPQKISLLSNIPRSIYLTKKKYFTKNIQQKMMKRDFDETLDFRFHY